MMRTMVASITELDARAFPERLTHIDDPPSALYLRGTLPTEERPHLSIVGSRKATAYGKAACETIVRDLAGTNIVIVSGLALGIDALAHKAALDHELTTIAVPGSGLDDAVLYPASHRALAHRIEESGGALVSEYPPDFRATRWSFPARNRIMAGLADVVLVIEASARSGTLITARLALEYNRDVCAVPGSIFTSQSTGTNALIAQGATPVRSGADVKALLPGVEDGKSSSEGGTSPSADSENEVHILTLLSEPTTKDEVIAASALPVEEAHATLSLLEMKGCIRAEGDVIMRVG